MTKQHFLIKGVADIEELKRVVAKNITTLRKKKGITQIEVAERLNYSDKAVSKWERGESLPDLFVLKQLADMFDVTLDYLVSDNHSIKKEKTAEVDSVRKRKQIDIMSLSVALVWLIATLVFVILHLTTGIKYGHYLTFVYAIPVSAIVWLVFNSIWFNRRTNYLIISVLMWSVLFAVYATFYIFKIRIGMLFILGIPGEIIIFIWSMLGKRK